MKHLIIALFAGLNSLCINAQTFENIRSELRDSVIVIYYDLIGTSNSNKALVVPYSSHNNFTKPLTNIHGDVGKVTAGNGKRISWFYGNELNNFNDYLTFELEAEAIINLQILKPTKYLRRGKDNLMQWAGGLPQDSVKLELISPENTIIWNAAILNKSKKFDCKPSKKLALGRGYEFKISSGDDQTIQPIEMRRKVSRIWIFSPAILAAGTTILLLKKSNEEPLPSAPSPPDSN